MTLMSMTFQEEYGELPTALLKAYRRYNGTVVDHDRLMEATDGDWALMLDIVLRHSETGVLRLPMFL